jgi:AmmeMemoRadiSam system protein A
MKTDTLTEKEKQYLLHLARESISCAVNHRPLPELEEDQLTPELKNDGASFVTLTINGNLRGCIGSLEAYQSLAEDVRAHAVHAALQDYRFAPVSPDEVALLKIEISRLTPARLIPYEKPDQLPGLLTPRVDGVILEDGRNRATFLPQVWDQLPGIDEFLSHLCRKMGASADLWKRKVLSVSVYQVEEFQEM